MSDLPSGSTVGGKLIIHKGIANNHRHHVSEIDGLGINPDNFQGDGGGIDATVLSGKTFTNLNNEFLNVANDTISSLVLAEHPTEDTQAASKLYVSQRASEGFTNGDFYGLTSIGTVSEELSYIVLNEYLVRINETDVMVNGWLGTLPEQNIDIRDINPSFTNKSFYLYVESVENQFSITASETKELNTENKIYAGRVDTDSTGIVSVEIVDGVSRFGIGKYMLSQTPQPDSIVISKETGLIDDGWLVGSKGETRTFLDGPTSAVSDDDIEYTITNYNSFSTYEVSATNFDMDVSIAGDTITVGTPNTVPVDTVETFTVTRDGFDSTFSLNLIGDPAPVVSGPTMLQSGGTYTYTIDNYNEFYSYNAFSNISGIGIDSISGNQVTISTAAKNPYDQNGYIEIERTGKSTQYAITVEADPAIGLTGPDTVYANSTYSYTITNYNSNYTYTVTSSLGTVTRSGSTVVLNTTGIASSEDGNNIRIDVSREGSSAFIESVFQQTYVLNAPQDFNPEAGGVLDFGQLFKDKYGIGTQQEFTYGSTTYYGALTLPDGVYEINISPSVNNIIYNKADGGGSHAMEFDFAAFPTTASVTVKLSGNIVGRGGNGGGMINFSNDSSVAGAQNGGDAIHIATNWSSNPRDVPITIDTRNANLYGGGGGGAASYELHVTRTDGPSITEGLVAAGVGGKSALSVPDGATPSSSAHQTSGTDFSFQLDYRNNPNASTNQGGSVRYRATDQGITDNSWVRRNGGAGGSVGSGGGVGSGGLYTDTSSGRTIGPYGVSSRVYRSPDGSLGGHSSTNSYQTPGRGGSPHNVTRDGLQGYIIL